MPRKLQTLCIHSLSYSDECTSFHQFHIGLVCSFMQIKHAYIIIAEKKLQPTETSQTNS